MNSVLLDTSFLISLSDPARAHHAQAVQYYRECVHRQVPMYLSTIVISEFQVRQSINDLPLRNFVVLPFNVDHAMRCGLLIRGLGLIRPMTGFASRMISSWWRNATAKASATSSARMPARWRSTWSDRARPVQVRLRRRLSCCATDSMRRGSRTARDVYSPDFAGGVR